MYGHGPNRIIDAQPFQQLRAENNQYSGNSTKGDGANRADPVARAGDGHQPGKESVNSKTHVPFFGSDEGVCQRRQTGGAGCEGRIGGNPTYAFEIHRGERAGGFEPETTKSNQQSSCLGDRIIELHLSTTRFTFGPVTTT